MDNGQMNGWLNGWVHGRNWRTMRESMWCEERSPLGRQSSWVQRTCLHSSLHFWSSEHSLTESFQQIHEGLINVCLHELYKQYFHCKPCLNIYIHHWDKYVKTQSYFVMVQFTRPLPTPGTTPSCLGQSFQGGEMTCYHFLRDQNTWWGGGGGCGGRKGVLRRSTSPRAQSWAENILATRTTDCSVFQEL